MNLPVEECTGVVHKNVLNVVPINYLLVALLVTWPRNTIVRSLIKTGRLSLIFRVNGREYR